MQSMDHGERREAMRRDYRVPVRVFIGGDEAAECQLESVDLGQDALFLRTDLLFSMGDELAFEFALGEQILSGQGRVKRVSMSSHNAGVVVGLGGDLRRRLAPFCSPVA